MKKLKVVQIGIGHDHASTTFNSLRKQSDIYEVVGWCPGEGEEERADHPAEVFAPELRVPTESALDIPGLDAVIVETDDWNLSRYALMAAKRGFPIHMDKPGGLSQEEFEELCSVMKKSGQPFQTGYMYRYNPAIRDAIARAKAGELGEIYCVETHMDCEHIPSKRQWLEAFPGGMLYFLGCHLIDLMVQVQGVPEEILPLSRAAGFDGVTGEDFGMTVFKYPHGCSFAKTTALEPGGFLRRQMVICGTRKTLELRPLEEYVPDTNGQMLTRTRECDAGYGWSVEGQKYASRTFDRYDAMMSDFAAMVRGESVNPFTLEYEARLHRIILAACGEKIDYKAEIKL